MKSRRRRAARKAARAFVNIAILIIFNENAEAKRAQLNSSQHEFNVYIRNKFY